MDETTIVETSSVRELHTSDTEPPVDSLQDTALLMLSFDANETQLLGFEEVLQITDYLYSAWCTDRDMAALQERNVVFFGQAGELLQRFRFYSGLTIALDKRALSIDNTDAELVRVTGERLTRISANILYGYDAMVQSYRQLYCNTPDLLATLPTLRMDVFFSPMVEDDMKTHQKLIRFYLEECNKRGYRRQQTSLFAPKFTELGHFTRTFTHACEVSEFIYDAVYPYHQHIWLFAALTEKSSIARHCQEYLENCYETDLPVLKKDRTKFSYRNGLYDARTNQFFEYGTAPVGWSSTEVCANYIDVDFDHATYSRSMHDSGDPMDISTPSIQKILDSQQFDREVCRWFYGSIGRMIFEVGEKDNWQFFPFCKGTAGSGKSTLLRLAAKFYNDVDVGNLMSEGQKTFSVEHIYNKYIFFCYDVDDKMNFSLTRWNQMVSGESIAIERKFKIALQTLWTVGGAFAGNSYPPWVDQAGNVSRRMLIFMFNKSVKEVDTRLFEKCMLEMGAFMKKCVSCYFQLFEKFGNRGIWDPHVLPTYFHTTKKQMQAETNPLQAFLTSDQVSLGDGQHVSFNNFRAAYLGFCENHRLPKKRLTEDFCEPLFSPDNIVIITPPPGSNPSDFDGHITKYLAGIMLNA